MKTIEDIPLSLSKNNKTVNESEKKRVTKKEPKELKETREIKLLTESKKSLVQTLKLIMRGQLQDERTIADCAPSRMTRSNKLLLKYTNELSSCYVQHLPFGSIQIVQVLKEISSQLSSNKWYELNESELMSMIKIVQITTGYITKASLDCLPRLTSEHINNLLDVFFQIFSFVLIPFTESNPRSMSSVSSLTRVIIYWQLMQGIICLFIRSSSHENIVSGTSHSHSKGDTTPKIVIDKTIEFNLSLSLHHNHIYALKVQEFLNNFTRILTDKQAKVNKHKVESVGILTVSKRVILQTSMFACIMKQSYYTYTSKHIESILSKEEFDNNNNKRLLMVNTGTSNIITINKRATKQARGATKRETTTTSTQSIKTCIDLTNVEENSRISGQRHKQKQKQVVDELKLKSVSTTIRKSNVLVGAKKNVVSQLDQKENKLGITKPSLVKNIVVSPVSIATNDDEEDNPDEPTYHSKQKIYQFVTPEILASIFGDLGTSFGINENKSTQVRSSYSKSTTILPPPEVSRYHLIHSVGGLEIKTDFPEYSKSSSMLKERTVVTCLTDEYLNNAFESKETDNIVPEVTTDDLKRFGPTDHLDMPSF